MYGLAYEQRKRVIFDFLYASQGGLLRRYRLPEHLSDDAIREEVNLLVEDINQLVPNGQTEADFRLLMPEINTAIRRRHGAQGWPPAKVFIAATEDAIKAVEKAKAAKAPVQVKKVDPLENAASKMRAKEPVAEHYFWGRLAVDLQARGLVDEETMNAYRSGAFFARKQQYGEAEAIRWEADAKARHQAALDDRRDRPIDPELMRQTQADLEGVGRAIDRRTQEMRGSR